MIKLTLNRTTGDNWGLLLRPDSIVSAFRSKDSEISYSLNPDGTQNYNDYFHLNVTEIILSNGKSYQVTETLDQILNLITEK